MNDQTQYDEIDPTTLRRGETIFLQSVEGETPLKATFLSSQEAGITAALQGSKTGFPFALNEWVVSVEKKYPLPDQQDISNTIYNAFERTKSGVSVSYGDIAVEILALMSGATATPVPLRPHLVEVPEPEVTSPEIESLNHPDLDEFPPADDFDEFGPDGDTF